MTHQPAFSTGDLAARLGHDKRDRVEYLLKSRKIVAAFYSGGRRMFTVEQAREIAIEDGKNPDDFFPLPPEAPEAPEAPATDSAGTDATPATHGGDSPLASNPSPGSLTTGAPSGAARGRVGRTASPKALSA